MNTGDFDFNLPPELIAINPVVPRDSCNLMVLNREYQSISHKKFHDLANLLNEGDVLVFNKSKVIPARIYLNHNNKKVEVLLVRRLDDFRWAAIGRPGKLLKGMVEFSLGEDVKLKVTESINGMDKIVEFSSNNYSMEEILKKYGTPPFPPYIKNTTSDLSDYQTVYAETDGSIASPTAGLHFTKKLLEILNNKGVQLEYVTLHVGLGTFLPIKVDVIENHLMHKEFYSIDKSTADRLNDAKINNKRIICVGTTTVRVLESSYDADKGFSERSGDTDIFIYPGYKWKCVDALITNFHLPKSTLLLLVSAFGGKNLIFNAYNEAIEHKYRFYSFGDAMIIL